MSHLPEVGIDTLAPGTPTIAGGFSATLLDRDYKWCAETMLNKFTSRALGRAERHAWEMLGDGNPGGYAIWTRVAATIRQTPNQHPGR